MSVHPDVLRLRAPNTIRARAKQLLDLACAGQLEHFAVDLPALEAVAERTAALTRSRFPDLRVPTHGRLLHFDAEGVPRVSALLAALSGAEPRERARALVDVVTVSVLLDAGAGMAWRYQEADTGKTLSRSEGLAVASLAWVNAGGLSSQGRRCHVDAAGLAGVTESALAEAFQVRADNPLVGLEGRVHLLRALGQALRERPDVFGAEGRIGGLVDALAAQHPEGKVPAAQVLALLLDALSPIWPGRLSLHGVPLGDVWRHPLVTGEGDTAGFMPFHKLSQWLAYSLFAPLETAGLTISEPNALTGLAEYRNGGLFVDLGVLRPKHAAVLGEAHPADALCIVEWRALTLSLLDLLLPKVRSLLGAPTLSLASMLEGGTWGLGRAVAAELRADGGPPVRVISDGTVF